MLLKPADALVLFLTASHHGGSLSPWATAQEKKAAPKLVGKWEATGVEYRGMERPPSWWFTKDWTFTEKTAVHNYSSLDGKADREQAG